MSTSRRFLKLRHLPNPKFAKPRRAFVHFTDLKSAVEIIKSRQLRASSFVGGIYAIAVGGEYTPGVQRTALGRARNRNWAVVFSTTVPPDRVYAEEVVWHGRKAIPLNKAKLVPARKVIELLHGKSYTYDDTGVILDY